MSAARRYDPCVATSETRWRTWRRRLAWLVGVGLGTVFGLMAKSTYSDAVSHCPTTSTCDGTGIRGGQDAHSQATISTLGFLAGSALLAGGVVLFLTSPKDGAVTGAVRVQPAVGAGGAGVRVGGAW